ncbi:hypothetical protein JOB18_021124 [Solea senegalensis]|uniref:Uncharacterized protein n=1 Tax=Solea senegalensis TaxID=28829 RepID=A0AAV6SA65_SOLSE|nr:hypothetical protein JOB18_021124 [Solea senegalensis]
MVAPRERFTTLSCRRPCCLPLLLPRWPVPSRCPSTPSHPPLPPPRGEATHPPHPLTPPPLHLQPSGSSASVPETPALISLSNHSGTWDKDSRGRSTHLYDRPPQPPPQPLTSAATESPVLPHPPQRSPSPSPVRLTPPPPAPYRDSAASAWLQRIKRSSPTTPDPLVFNAHCVNCMSYRRPCGHVMHMSMFIHVVPDPVPHSPLTHTLTHKHTHTNTHTLRHKHTHLHKHTHTLRHTLRHKHTHTHTHTHTLTHKHTQTHTHTHTHTLTHTHTQTHTHTHLHTHTHTHT